jgi:hypothetical protein
MISDFVPGPAGQHLAAQPGAGEDPMAICRARGNAQDGSGLIACQTREVAQLDQSCLERIVLGETTIR